ncbi:MAG: hypothetical protein ABIL20_06940 [candidate division WOR-3 bacterium]
MRFLLYFILCYVLLPVNSTIDFISIILYFIILNEDEKFSIAFAFFAGLLMDLYLPVSLGLNTLIFLILGQALIFLKKYFVREPLTLFFIFLAFYLIRILLLYLINGITFNITTILLTVIVCLPVYYLLSKLCFRVWMRI